MAAKRTVPAWAVTALGAGVVAGNVHRQFGRTQRTAVAECIAPSVVAIVGVGASNFAAGECLAQSVGYILSVPLDAEDKHAIVVPLLLGASLLRCPVRSLRKCVTADCASFLFNSPDTAGIRLAIGAQQLRRSAGANVGSWATADQCSALRIVP